MILEGLKNSSRCTSLLMELVHQRNKGAGGRIPQHQAIFRIFQ